MSTQIDQQRETRRQRWIELTVRIAQRRRAEGASLFAIAQELGVTKEWLRTYASLS
jgi:hypothetical protein